MAEFSALLQGRTVGELPETKYEVPKQVPAVNASLVTPKENKLEYKAYNEEGDKIGDFSYAGFYAGKYELPVTENLHTALELSPSGTDDDTDLIQNAIDSVYSLYPDLKIKVIKLKAGIYNINKNGINLKSGILLSGEGQGPTGTILYAKERVKHNVITVMGKEPVKIGSDSLILDKYIKSGSNIINVSIEDAKQYKKGDRIVIYHPSTYEWIKGIEMADMINIFGDNNSWKPDLVDMYTERTVTNVSGREITVDFPFFVPYNKEYSQSYIYKIDTSGKCSDIGIENLRIISAYNGDPIDENHATNGIWVANAENIFVRNVSTKYLYNSLITCADNVKQVTAVNCSCLDPVSEVTGGRRYSFATSTSAQQILYTGCYAYDGRHDFEASYSVTGPIAFVDNISDSSNVASETHGTWSTGVLYDNLYHVPNWSKGIIALANRGIFGTKLSQGWTSAGSVIWNSLSSAMIAHKPPLTYQNFVVGTWGLYEDSAAKEIKNNYIISHKKIFRSTSKFLAEESNFVTKEGSPVVGDVYIENEFSPVEPRSLYKAQLAQRITGSIKNARPNAPVLIYPRSDKITDDCNVTVSGIFQYGAKKVNIYVDDCLYDAKLDENDNSFLLELSLKCGVHKIYATQTINGTESTKTADRFITIGKAEGNPSYLQSIYSPCKTRLLVNDLRCTFDEVIKEEN